MFELGNSWRPASGSLLGRWLARGVRHPDAFVCGVRVLSGVVPGEGERWRYRRSAVDRLVSAGVITLNHGSQVVLRLRLDVAEDQLATPARTRPGHVVRSAVEQTTGARVAISADVGDIDRLG